MPREFKKMVLVIYCHWTRSTTRTVLESENSVDDLESEYPIIGDWKRQGISRNIWLQYLTEYLSNHHLSASIQNEHGTVLICPAKAQKKKKKEE